MKNTVALLVLAAVAAPALAQEEDAAAMDSGRETYFGVLGNYLASPDSGRDPELDQGYGLHGFYGIRPTTGLQLELRGFYDQLEPKSDALDDAYRFGGLAHAVFPFADLIGVSPFALAGGGVTYTDATRSTDSEFDLLASLGLGALSQPLTESGWRLRGELRYVAENIEDDVLLDLHAALGLQIPLTAMTVEPPAEAVEVVESAAPADSDGDGVLDDADACPGTPAGTVVNEEGCAPAAPADAPVAEPKVLKLEGVKFAVNSAQLLQSDPNPVLDDAAQALNTQYPDAQVEVAGHTDDQGDDAYNLDLSQRRAEAVRQYLITQGVDEARLTAVGYGETQPIADNASAAGRAENRRVELRVKD